MSLANSSVAVMLPVEDVDRAARFYSEKLGLEHAGRNVEGAAVFVLDGGASLMLLPRPGGTRADSTALTWQVEDLPRTVKELVGSGVVFEDYDLPDLRTVEHIAEREGERAAWFLDPDGNVLCVHEVTG